jgi:FkbH-like protein
MLKIAVLSNININSLKYQLKKGLACYFADGYDTWQYELLTKDSEFYNYNPAFCFLIIDGKQFYDIKDGEFKIIDNTLGVVKKAADYLPSCRFFVSDIDVINIYLSTIKQGRESTLLEFEWSKRLSVLVKNYKNIYNFPLKEILLTYGRDTIYSSKMWYAASNRFSVSGEQIIAEKIRQLIHPALFPAKKCLILDLDNTLWGGVISEDGVGGIQLDNHGEGARFYDFQNILLEIHRRGVLLAVVSKNNKEDVDVVFSHPRMLIKKDDFSALAIGWESKADNIIQIARTLNIGLDSLVFVDDNPVEREEVQRRLSEVVVAEFPSDTTRLYQFAINLYNQYFYAFDISNEDINKVKMYEENAKRIENINNFSSLEDFLIDLEIKLHIEKVSSELLVRVHQMLQKTNQFNVTTKRYSENDLINMLNDNKILMFLGNVRDKYGDNGNSILIIIRMISDVDAEIDSFLMSCRIMNRNIEFDFLYEVERMLKSSMRINNIFAAYFRTSKNIPAAEFFENAGYEIVKKDEDKKMYKFSFASDNMQKRKKCYASII